MPKRPRTHQLEDESWKALSNAIPNQWVLRKPQPDYGIDAEIEIFDHSGSSTGMMFLAQLKGTDTKTLSLSLPLETLDYYKSLPMPVLLVRFYSPSKELYFRWVHGIDPYHSRKRSSKSASIKFTEENKWTDQTPDFLVRYLKIFEQLHNPRLPRPIKFVLEFSEKEVFSVATAKIESIVRNAARSLSDIISFSTTPDDEMTPKIKITKDLIEIHLSGVFGCTFHISSKNYSKERIKHLPHDVLIAISLALHGLGHDNIAADIANEHILSSSLFKNFKILLPIISCFTASRRIDEALKIAKQYLELYDYDPSIYMVFSLPAFRKAKMTDSEFQAFKELHLIAIDKAKKAGFMESAANCCYNLGNYMRGRGRDWSDKREALKYYLLAAKYDPNYRKRTYFWEEVAGIFFGLDKFSFSEKFYNKAIELGASANCMALRADALMFAGRYKDAKKLFEEYANKTDEVDSEWILKLWVLDELIRIVKIEKQTRNPLKAMQIADLRGIPSEEKEKRLELAFEYDGLCGLAWFNHGVQKKLNKEHQETLISFLIAGLVQPNDIEAWSNVLFCAFNCPEYVWLIPHVVSTAYFVNGEEFLGHFSQIVEEKDLPREAKTEIINIIGAIMHEFSKSKEQRPIIRLFNPDGTYKMIDYKGSWEKKRDIYEENRKMRDSNSLNKTDL